MAQAQVPDWVFGITRLPDNKCIIDAYCDFTDAVNDNIKACGLWFGGNMPPLKPRQKVSVLSLWFDTNDVATYPNNVIILASYFRPFAPGGSTCNFSLPLTYNTNQTRMSSERVEYNINELYLGKPDSNATLWLVLQTAGTQNKNYRARIRLLVEDKYI